MRVVTRYVGCLIALASLLLFPLPAQSQALTPYYVYTGQTGAQTQVDTNHKSSFTISAASEIDFYGGSFVMKAGQSSSTPITLTLYDSAAKTNVLSSVTLSAAQFCAIHGGNCSSYDVTKFDLPSPVRLLPGRAYYAELTSRAPDTQSLAYFIKGGNSCYVASASGSTLPDAQCSYVYTPTTGGSPTLQIAKSGPATAEAGVPFAYTLTVTNVGDGDAATGTVKDQLPAGLTFVSATGAGWSCSTSGSPALVTCRYSGTIAARGGTSKITVTASPSGAGTFVNWASIDPTGGTLPTTPSASSCAGLSQSVCDSAQTVVTAAAAELSIAKEAPVPALAGGTQSTYTLTVENTGGAPATAVQVKDQLPSGMSFVSASGSGWSCTASSNIVTCNYSGSIAPSGSSSVSMVVRLPVGASGAYENRAFVKTDGTPIDTLPPACNSDAIISCSSNTSTVGSGLLKIEKSNPSPGLQVGTASTYTLTVTNVGGGPITATSTALKDLLPAYVDLVSVSSGWGCVPGSTASPASNSPVAVACALTTPVNLAVNDSVSLAMTVKPRSGVAASVTNYAAVDPTGGNTPLTPGPSCEDATSCAENTAEVESALPDLIVNKLAPIPALAGGEQSTYPINVVNQGAAVATVAQVKDELPDGMSFVSASGAGWSCSASNGVVTCNFSGAIDPGETSSINIAVSLPPEAAGETYENRAFVKRDGSPLGPLPSTCTTDETTSCSANVSELDAGLLQIKKSGPTAALQVGVESTYTISVTNIGGSAISATRAALKDLLPAYVDLVSVSSGWACTPGTTDAPLSNAPVEIACALTTPAIIGVNRSKTLDLTVRPRAGIAESVTNYASVDPTGGNAPPTPGPACTDPTACAQVTTNSDPVAPELTVEKDAPVPPLKQGARSTYTINVSNQGDAPATFAQVKDQLPVGMNFVRASGSGWICDEAGSGVVTCNYRGLIGPGEISTIEVLVSLPEDASGSYENRAYVKKDGTPIGPVPRTCTSGSALDCSSNTSTVGEGLLSIDKSEPEPALQMGVESTYTITVTNVGGGPIDSSTVNLKDLLPAYLDLVSVSPGWACSPGSTEAPGSDSAVEVSCALKNPVSIAVNGSKTLQIGVKPRLGIAETVTNFAAVDPTGGETPLTPGPNCVDATSCTEQTSDVDPSLPELTVSKLAPDPALTAGGESTYKILVENEGGAAVSSVQVKDRLPEGMEFVSASGASSSWMCAADDNGIVTCDYEGSLEAGGTSSIDVVVSLPEDATGEYENQAFVRRDGTPISELPDTCTSDATISCSANTSAVDTGLLKIEKSGPNPALQVGAESTYTITITNVGSGPIDETTANIKDLMPAYLNLVSVSSGWRCTPGSTASPESDTETEIACALAAPARIGVDKSRTLEFTVKPRTGVAAEVTNYASVDPTGGTEPPTPGPDCTDATSCVENTASVVPSSSIKIEKSSPDAEFVVNAEAHYTLTVTNPAAVDASDVTIVQDRLPAGMSFVSAGGSGWSCSASGESAEGVLIACQRSGAFSDASEISVVGLPGESLAGTTVTNWTSAGTGPDESAAQPPEPYQCTEPAVCDSLERSVVKGGYTISKSQPSPELAVGRRSVYTIHVTAEDAGTVTEVKDQLPDGMTLVSTRGKGWDCALQPGNLVTCSKAVPAGTKEKIDVEVEVGPALTDKRVTNYASVGPEGQAPQPGPKCAAGSSSRFCAASTAKVSDIRERISKAVEEDVQAFMASRLDRLVSFAGRGSRLQHFRNTQCGWNHDGTLNGNGTEKSAQFDGAASVDFRLPGKTVVPTADAPPEECGGLNVWSQLEFDYVAGREGANSQTAMATVGLEYLLTPSILAGVRATFDYTDFDMDGASEANSQIIGKGWFAGPYVSAELVQNIFLDAFLGYGTSWNDYTGRFERFDLTGEFTTQRLLGGATLTGQFESGAFLFLPSAGIAYGKEWSDSFNVDNDAFGSAKVDGKTVELTRLSAEFETTYRTTVGDGNPFEVFIAPTITYDFFQNSGEEAEDILGGDLRGGVDGGFRFSDDNFNMSLRVGYDGIGLQDWGAYTGEVQFNYTW